MSVEIIKSSVISKDGTTLIDTLFNKPNYEVKYATEFILNDDIDMNSELLCDLHELFVCVENKETYTYYKYSKYSSDGKYTLEQFDPTCIKYLLVPQKCDSTSSEHQCYLHTWDIADFLSFPKRTKKPVLSMLKTIDVFLNGAPVEILQEL